MKKVVFCEIAWMKYYAGVFEDDKPMNGGKYIEENEDGGEVFNFTPYNHKCYGYVMHYGDELHIERYDKILKSFDEVRDMTVVWVASDGKSSKIVGWYEHATMFRFWQSYYDSMYSGDRWNNYNFVADEKDCYLIDEKDRTFSVPRAPIAGKGRGMGQSQVWYADSTYAQEEFIPQVLAYFDSIRSKCEPVYFLKEEISKCAEDHGETTEELIKKCIDSSRKENSDLFKTFGYINLAVAKDDCYETRAVRGDLFGQLGWYNEAEEEYKQALYFEQNVATMEALMYVELMLNHSFLAIDLGEKMRVRKDEVENWSGIAANLTYCYIGECEFDAASLLIEECEKDSEREYAWTSDAKKVLEERKQELKDQRK